MLEYFSLNYTLFLPKLRKYSSSRPERQIHFHYYNRTYHVHSTRERRTLNRRLLVSNGPNQSEIMTNYRSNLIRINLATSWQKKTSKQAKQSTQTPNKKNIHSEAT